MDINRAFGSPDIVEKLRLKIANLSKKQIKIMEFCGTHTHVIFRYGIRQLLPETISMFSGPGCPVCVTDEADIDRIIAMAEIKGVMIATFGDLMKVPGSSGSLIDARADGAKVEVVYSPLDAVHLAIDNSHLNVVFLGVGFETTAPAVAASIVEAEKIGLNNYYVLSLHKLTPPAMKAILDTREVDLDGILCPGHVSTITGYNAWNFVSDIYGIPAVVAGFEPLDILWGIGEIVVQCEAEEAHVVNAYPRSVTAGGNLKAKEMIERVFKTGNAFWRGLGELPESGLYLRDEYGHFDASKVFPVQGGERREVKGCRCAEVIRGKIKPDECNLFRTHCNPFRPKGPCMVSSEGSCAAYYLYG
ncbi:MAG: hydrogenase formation protein HypD [Syntrophorhabdaceae bacterium]|nr:hydrogenase formation protein HypD [Syntrophorhabdaceae bacterium]